MNYWLMANGHKQWIKEEQFNDNLIGMGWNLGDLTHVKSREELRELADWEIGEPSLLALWQFSHEMAIGDIVYLKEGLYEISARGVITSDYIYDSSREYHDIRRVEWTHKERIKNSRKLPRKTLTKYADPERIRELEALYGLSTDISLPEEVVLESEEELGVAQGYTKTNFLSEVYLSSEEYDKLVNLLESKKNIILQGAPGVGKTFAAKRLAYAMMGEKADDQVKMVQFHQSYSYEDFVMGYRPDSDSFKLKEGPFYTFCQKAREDRESPYFFIIDEINRGNMSKIFGELLMLIEADKRNSEYAMPLMYFEEEEEEDFYIPENLYIIGMMNTADRSLAMIDYALRRRFAFFDMKPAFANEQFKAYQSKLANNKFDKLIEQVKALNQDIVKDSSLGTGFEIGHSYFCRFDQNKKPTDADLNSIVEHELIPLLREYWFDNQERVEESKDKQENGKEKGKNNWAGILRSAIK